MRHELIINGMVITTDNSAAIGEKDLDVVKAPDRITAKFSARVALLEQWAAGSEPAALLLQNFSGGSHWDQYVDGVEELFHEAGLSPLPISGSSETNMETLQSGIAVTIIGKKTREIDSSNLNWFVYGRPLTGQDVLDNPSQIADLKKLHELMEEKLIHCIWPVGSKGIAAEMKFMINKTVASTEPALDLNASGGPSTAVLVGVEAQNINAIKERLEGAIHSVKFMD